MGVLIAVLIVLDIQLPEIFGVVTLNNLLSLVFFGWFVAVFIWLATRALPKGNNLLSDAVIVAGDVAKKFTAALLPPVKK